MTQKDKLSRLIASYDSTNACNQCHKHLKDCDNCESPTLADYLLEHGTVVLPFKVGDTVYHHDSERIYESRVRDIIFDAPTVAFNTEAVGKAVFLTREEAEAALKGEKHD